MSCADEERYGGEARVTKKRCTEGGRELRGWSETGNGQRKGVWPGAEREEGMGAIKLRGKARDGMVGPHQKGGYRLVYGGGVGDTDVG